MISFLATVEFEQHDNQRFILSIYEQYKRIMFSTVRNYIPNCTMAEDLVQDALVKLIQKIPTMRKLNEKALSAYIVNTVKNVTINHIKNQQSLKNFM